MGLAGRAPIQTLCDGVRPGEWRHRGRILHGALPPLADRGGPGVAQGEPGTACRHAVRITAPFVRPHTGTGADAALAHSRGLLCCISGPVLALARAA